MNRVENVSRFVAALAQNPNHANETAPNIVDMAEELADEVEKRPSCEDSKYFIYKGMIVKEEHREHFVEDPSFSLNNPKPLPLKIMQGITFGLCIIVVAGLLIYGFTNACRWVCNFYS